METELQRRFAPPFLIAQTLQEGLAIIYKGAADNIHLSGKQGIGISLSF
ncbi:MAG: hypothetical protein HOA72_22490 [Desulfobacula sp.]|nr:hypothetical protein [Desulfobacteraceae bacterium]MBT4639473.1 hypothetical protein [Deltaproteobacteria bacterium]MBT6751693.1 hypothetical protein [Desulfobacula sp.]MBT6499295.1 hypothetical protein [Deltaproteobacteria bacterium]MBT7632148.1 hypothetical protein [Desulfobacula sp.]